MNKKLVAGNLIGMLAFIVLTFALYRISPTLSLFFAGIILSLTAIILLVDPAKKP